MLIHEKSVSRMRLHLVITCHVISNESLEFAATIHKSSKQTKVFDGTVAIVSNWIHPRKNCVGNLSPAIGARNQVGIGLSYRTASLCS